ncbi:hypothetical protein ONE63_000417 [Megalurothrips usitatus]|uniref:DNA polymerase zeta catalytic subunit n=1 Tax=Megalurothrips usitatus TaxID=439358 RepID=A0AAV7Y0W0_9NEOP|nr:hypothetical protein ONE63_000417 [Megalurothrips usitatus]
MFQVRIIKVDHYMSAPIPELDVTFSDFRKSSIKSVPVIRIFGSTPKGEKTCVHVHGIFPYICVPYDGSEPFPKLAHQLAASLDKAINIASGFSTSNSQHVYKVVLVSGIPFYGYHRHRHQFLKIYFYKPSVIKQAVSLLQNGAILNKLFQPHEAHIPFILQFFIDFNLYGMSFIDFQTVKFRRTKHIESVDIAPERILPVNIPPLSLSQFEVDALACHISNRPSSQGDGQLSNPGLAAIWEDERNRRLNIDGTPLGIPQLHSQRPVQKSTPSELFFLRRIQGILENSSQAADDSSLSGGTLGPTNRSYAIEDPANTAAVDASFVSLHLSAEVDSEHPLDDDTLDETVVNEDIVAMSQSLTSQSLDRSLALEVEDFELLDALETLADAVDDNSVLGSQTARGKSHDADDSSSEGEDEKWHDKTLIAEEDEAMKLLDLTMPEFDEAAILNDYVNKENQPGPSCSGRIPQVDGPSGEHARSTFRIPQLDGMNDVPLKPGRKSLGMRGGSRSRSSNRVENCSDNRYNAQGELIFRFKSSSTSESRAGPSTDINVDDGVSQSYPSSNFLTKTQTKKTAAYNIPGSSSVCVSPTVQCASYDQQQILLCDETTINNGLLIGSSTEVAPTEPDLYFPSQPTIQNTLSESVIENVLSQQDLFTQSSIQNTISEQLICLMPQCLEEPLVTRNVAEELAPAFFSEAMELQDQDVSNTQPPVICCSSATVGCAEDCSDNFDGEDGVNAFLDEIARRVEEPVLRGDPSLYPEAPPEKEESLADLLSAALCKANSGGEDCAEMPVDVVKTDVKEESIGSRVRRSSRHASHDSTSRNIVVPEFPTPDQLAEKDKPSVSVDGLEDTEGNLSPCSCYDLTGFGDTMFNSIHDYGVSTVEWTNFGAGASDIELCRLSGALEKGQMEEILQTGCEETESAVASTTTRRDEVMQHLLETQKTAAEPIKMECQGTCSKAKAKQRSVLLTGTSRGDPVTDELLHRGIKPRAGPPRLGKNMKLAKLFCSTPNFRRTPPVKKSAEHQLKRQRRQQRKSKLSITAQRMKRQCKSSSKRLPPMKPCCVALERLTKSTIRRVCNKSKVKLKDEVLQFIRKYENSSLSFSQSSDTLNCSGRSTESTEVLENPSIRASLKCSPLEVTKASILCGGKSRRSYQKRFTNPQLCEASASTDSNIQDVSVNVTHVAKVQDTVHETLSSTASAMHQNDYASDETDRCGRSRGKKRDTNRLSVVQSSAVEILSQQQVHEVTVLDNVADNLKDPRIQKPKELLPNEDNTPSHTVDNDEPRNALLLYKNESNLYEVQSVRRRGRKPLLQKGHSSKQETVNSVDIKPKHVSKTLSSVKELPDSKAAVSRWKSTCVNAKNENVDDFKLGIFEEETKISPYNLECSSLLPNELDSSDKNERPSPRSSALEKIVKKVITPAKKLSSRMRKRRSSSVQHEKQDNIAKSVPVRSSPREPTSKRKVDPISTNVLSTKENVAKVLKNYKIPKKQDLSREVAPQKCNLKEAKEVNGTHCLSAPSTSDIIETCKEINSSFYLSLDASGMDLYLSEGNNREKETETPSCTGKFTGVVSPGKSFSTYPQSISRSDHFKPIMCVDGAQTESSSDSSSGGQCEDQAGSSNLSKRKWPSMSDEVCSQSGKMGDGSGPSRKRNHEGVTSWAAPEIDTSCVPMSVAHWFAKPYAPWSVWSPVSSPNAHHHAHLFSPPRAESPEVSNFCGFPTGAGCM